MPDRGILLELQPVDRQDVPEAFTKALTVLARFYGIAANLELSPSLPHPPGLAGELADLDRQLAKALPAHPSHYQHRAAGGQFTVRKPHHHTQRNAQGRFRQRLDRQERQAAAAEAADLVAEFTERLQDHRDDLQRGALTPEQFLRRCERDLRHFYRECYRRGKQAVGDPAIRLTPQDTAALNRLVTDELDFLKKFAADMVAGKGRVPYPQRMAYYGRAAWEAVWMGWILGDQRGSREVRWVLGSTAESCGDCNRFAQLGWLPVRDFTREVLVRGYTPRSGQLECTGVQCDCRLEERVDGVLQPALTYPGGG